MSHEAKTIGETTFKARPRVHKRAGMHRVTKETWYANRRILQLHPRIEPFDSEIEFHFATTCALHVKAWIMLRAP